MTKRTLSGAQLLRAAVGAGILPADTVVGARPAEARWSERGLDFVAYVDPGRRFGEITWISYACDPRYGASRERGGLGASAGVRHVGANDLSHPLPSAPPWPTGSRPDDVALAFLRSGLGASRTFVRDRSDLVSLLMRPRDIIRGDLTTWLYQGYPSRLLEALLIARDMGDAEREEEITGILNSDLPEHWCGTPEPMRVVARRWAKELAKDFGRPIEF
jgi:hypothetical protein